MAVSPSAACSEPSGRARHGELSLAPIPRTLTRPMRLPQAQQLQVGRHRAPLVRRARRSMHDPPPQREQQGTGQGPCPPARWRRARAGPWCRSPFEERRHRQIAAPTAELPHEVTHGRLLVAAEIGHLQHRRGVGVAMEGQQLAMASQIQFQGRGERRRHRHGDTQAGRRRYRPRRGGQGGPAGPGRARPASTILRAACPTLTLSFRVADRVRDGCRVSGAPFQRPGGWSHP